MKKTCCFFLILVLAISSSTAALAGCSEHPRAEEYHRSYFLHFTPWNANYHQAVYADDMVCLECDAWVSGGDYSELAPHVFTGNTCTSCGYVRTDTTPSHESLQRAIYQRITQNPNEIIGKTATVIHSGNVRASTSAYADIVGTVLPKDEFQVRDYLVVDSDHVWLQIRYGSGNAWISASLVEISTAAVSAESSGIEHFIGRMCTITVSGGRARVAPGTQNPVIDTVSHGQSYKILDTQYASNGTLWFQIQTDDALCWISSGIAEVS